MSTQRPALGKGLASLLPGAPSQAANISNVIQGAQIAKDQEKQATDSSVSAASSAAINTADRVPGIGIAFIEDISMNPYQPRREFDETRLAELALSIRENGIIQPVVVRKVQGGYQLIAGERRYRAAKLAGLKQLPVIVKKTTDRESLELAIVENVQRQDLNCIDEAASYQRLMEEFKLTQDEVAKKVGKERATVANTMRLLRLPEAVLDDLRRGILSPGHGKALLSLTDIDQILLGRKLIIEKRWSVRATELWVDEVKKLGSGSGAETKQSANGSEALNNLALDLTRWLGVKVKFSGTEQSGKIILEYHSKDSLQGILNHLDQKKGRV